MKNNIVLKLYDIKKEYMDDMKLLINNNDNENIIKILDKVEKENNKLIEEIIPKSNNHYYSQYENLMKTFKEEIKKDNGQDNFEIKYNNLIKNIESSIINHQL
jgi:predicted transcriptional regulator